MKNEIKLMVAKLMLGSWMVGVACGTIASLIAF
jgi:hypothetical protein